MQYPFTRERWEALRPSQRALAAAGGLLLLAVVLTLVRMALPSDMAQRTQNTSMQSGFGYDAAPSVAMDGDASLAYPAYEERSMPWEPTPVPSAGSIGTYDEEAYERRSYDVRISTSNLVDACTSVESWKATADIVFEQSARTDRSCDYRFKVARARAAEVLASLEALDPKQLSEQVESVRQALLDYDTQTDVLLRKQALLTDALNQATQAYDELVTLATQTNNVDTLAKVIEQKLRHIERLTDARLSIAQRLEQVARAQAQVRDSIAFVTFAVHVTKYTIIDTAALTDTWIAEAQRFVRVLNSTLQQLTLGLLANLLTVLVIACYLAILFIFVRFGVRVWKHVWTASNESQ